MREYIWLGDQVLTVIAGADTASPTPYWVTNDHLGRPEQMTDASQNVVWRAKYAPFGETLAITGPASLDLRFPGQWFQLESGLAWNWYRHYDASLGRYVQPDPLGISQGPSLYGYGRQSPLMGVDPEGRFFWLVPAAIVAAAILSPEIANAPSRQDTPIPASPLSPYVNGVSAGALACEALPYFAAEGGEATIGDILAGSHSDTMIHLTNDPASAFASGVDQGTFFARFGDVSEMTVPQYQSDVVGMGAAAGPGQPVSGFITAGPGNAGAFGQAGVWNNAGIMEYTNGASFIPHSYVPLP